MDVFAFYMHLIANFFAWNQFWFIIKLVNGVNNSISFVLKGFLNFLLRSFLSNNKIQKVEDLSEKSMNTKICSFWIINRSQSLYFKNSFFNITNCKEARKCHLTNLIPYVSSVNRECSNGKNVSFSINNRPNNLRFFFNLHTPFTDTYILYSPSWLSRLLCYG